MGRMGVRTCSLWLAKAPACPQKDSHTECARTDTGDSWWGTSVHDCYHLFSLFDHLTHLLRLLSPLPLPFLSLPASLHFASSCHFLSPCVTAVPVLEVNNSLFLSFFLFLHCYPRISFFFFGKETRAISHERAHTGGWTTWKTTNAVHGKWRGVFCKQPGFLESQNANLPNC